MTFEDGTAVVVAILVIGPDSRRGRAVTLRSAAAAVAAAEEEEEEEGRCG